MAFRVAINAINQYYNRNKAGERGSIMATATKKQTTTQVVDIQTAFKNARKLQEKEQLPLVDKLYTCDVDKSTGVVTVTITANLSDVVRSSNGSNFVLPLANVKGVRGTGVIQAVSDSGLICKLYADRVYLSTLEIEKEKKTPTNSRTAKLEADMQALLQRNKEAEERAERLEAMMAELLANQKK